MSADPRGHGPSSTDLGSPAPLLGSDRAPEVKGNPPAKRGPGRPRKDANASAPAALPTYPGTALTVPGEAHPKPLRGPGGRVLPGHSTNRSGRPKGVAALAKEFQCRIPHDELVSWVYDIWKNRVALLDDTGAPVLDEHGEQVYVKGSFSHAEQMQAYQVILDRGYGKPIVAVDMQAMVASVSVEEGPNDAFAAIDPLSLPDSLMTAYAALFAHVAGVEDPALAYIDTQARELPVSAMTDVREPDSGQASAITDAGADRTTDASGQVSVMADGSADATTERGRESSNPEANRAHASSVPDPSADVVVTGEPEQPSDADVPVPPREHTWPANASSNVVGFEHDERTGELRVRFKSGARYAYANVTTAQVDAWLRFPSPGQWLYQNLKAKPDVHPCRAISSEADA